MVFSIIMWSLLAVLGLFFFKKGQYNLGLLSVAVLALSLNNHFQVLIVPGTVNTWINILVWVAFVLAIAAFWGSHMFAFITGGILSTLATVAALLLAVSPALTQTAQTQNAIVAQPTSTADNPTGESLRTTAPEGTGTSTQATRDPRFVQSWDPNTNFKFRAKGLWDDLKSGAASVKGATTKISESMGHDARYLAIVAWYEGITTNRDDWQSLVTADKSYLSDEGIELYNKIQKRWVGAKVSIQDAPKDMCNSGSDNGRFVANATCGLSGNVKALVFTHPDNTRTIYLVRCANPVLPPKAHHSMPKGRTDSTPPPVKHNPPKKSPPPANKPPKKSPPSTHTPTPAPELVKVCRIADRATVSVTKEEASKPEYAPLGSPKCADQPTPTETPTPTPTTPTTTPTATPTPTPTTPTETPTPTPKETKDVKNDPKLPEGKPKAPKPTRSPEVTPPKESNPAKPPSQQKTHDPAPPEVQAPGSDPVPDRSGSGDSSDKNGSKPGNDTADNAPAPTDNDGKGGTAISDPDAAGFGGWETSLATFALLGLSLTRLRRNRK